MATERKEPYATRTPEEYARCYARQPGWAETQGAIKCGTEIEGTSLQIGFDIAYGTTVMPAMRPTGYTLPEAITASTGAA